MSQPGMAHALTLKHIFQIDPLSLNLEYHLDHFGDLCQGFFPVLDFVLEWKMVLVGFHDAESQNVFFKKSKELLVALEFQQVVFVRDNINV